MFALLLMGFTIKYPLGVKLGHTGWELGLGSGYGTGRGTTMRFSGLVGQYLFRSARETRRYPSKLTLLFIFFSSSPPSVFCAKEMRPYITFCSSCAHIELSQGALFLALWMSRPAKVLKRYLTLGISTAIARTGPHLPLSAEVLLYVQMPRSPRLRSTTNEERRDRLLTGYCWTLSSNQLVRDLG